MKQMNRDEIIKAIEKGCEELFRPLKEKYADAILALQDKSEVPEWEKQFDIRFGTPSIYGHGYRRNYIKAFFRAELRKIRDELLAKDGRYLYSVGRNAIREILKKYWIDVKEIFKKWGIDE